MGRSELTKGTLLHFPGGQTYEILETIGCGSSALLYEAKEQGSAMRFAIKELYPAGGYVRENGQIVARNGSAGLGRLKETLEWRDTYLSQRASRRNHQVLFSLPPVWHSVDIELPDGTRYENVENTYVRMESLREKGISLGEYIRAVREKGNVSLDEALQVMMTVLDAYAPLHEDGFIHGDCQKENLFLLYGGYAGVGTACINDFDAARELGEDGFTAPIEDEVFATDGYCPPELLLRDEGYRMSPACDVWALGFLLLELLTDRGMDEQSDLTEYLLLHPGERQLKPWELVRLHCTPKQGELLNGLIGKAMALDPEARYRDAGEMRQVLRTLRRCRELELYDEISKARLWEQLGALAAWMLQTQRACFDREELSQWLRQNAEPGALEEMSAEQLLYYGVERLAVLEQVDGKFCFEETARVFFADRGTAAQ